MPYLELRSGKDGPALFVDCERKNLKFELLDDKGRVLKPRGPIVVSGPENQLGKIFLPVDSVERISLDERNLGFPNDAKTVIPAAGFIIEDYQNGKVFLRLKLSTNIGEAKAEGVWNGELTTPPTRIEW